MALIKCKECGKEISKQADACPNCGYKNKKKTSKLAWFIVGIVLFFIYSSVRTGQDLIAQAEKRVEANKSGGSVSTPAATLPENTWEYDTSQDKMGRGEVKTAHVVSKNEVNFKFPYSGAQSGILMIRKHPKYGTDVMFSIEKGQFHCRIDGCNVSVKFGDDKAEVFSAGEPNDSSTTTLFIRGSDRFVKKLKTSPVTKIEATFYQEGSRVFEFNTANFQW